MTSTFNTERDLPTRPSFDELIFRSQDAVNDTAESVHISRSEPSILNRLFRSLTTQGSDRGEA